VNIDELSLNADCFLFLKFEILTIVCEAENLSNQITLNSTSKGMFVNFDTNTLKIDP
jgi:hypothetical protein